MRSYFEDQLEWKLVEKNDYMLLAKHLQARPSIISTYFDGFKESFAIDKYIDKRVQLKLARKYGPLKERPTISIKSELLVDINLRGTLLHYAIFLKRNAAVEILLQNGADPFTPLQVSNSDSSKTKAAQSMWCKKDLSTFARDVNNVQALSLISKIIKEDEEENLRRFRS
eukprot:TRINITY_DN788_c0_g5_i1.p1 TRINITY_DN788_c0_g5~~TRINITY_DN788_c0_g5_i1.p1  ORF type:complete len:170 (+),score=24.18 TRINITY_DN788_c0_g5_i1:53-562(+)